MSVNDYQENFNYIKWGKYLRGPTHCALTDLLHPVLQLLSSCPVLSVHMRSKARCIQMSDCYGNCSAYLIRARSSHVCQLIYGISLCTEENSIPCRWSGPVVTQMMWMEECHFSEQSLPDTEFFSSVQNTVFWDVTQCGSCKNRRSSETSDLTRATRRNIPEDCIIHSSRHLNLKSYVALFGWTL
jgi:hypothetical protein